LLYWRMNEIKLDRMEITQADAQVMRDLQRVCTVCGSKRRTPAANVEGRENLPPSAIEALVPRYPFAIARIDSISRSRAGSTPSSTRSHPGSLRASLIRSHIFLRRLEVNQESVAFASLASCAIWQNRGRDILRRISSKRCK
jgi:hypothetical protein